MNLEGVAWWYQNLQYIPQYKIRLTNRMIVQVQAELDPLVERQLWLPGKICENLKVSGNQIKAKNFQFGPIWT